MCAYKLVTIKFKWWGLQNKVENFIQKVSASALWGCVDVGVEQEQQCSFLLLTARQFLTISPASQTIYVLVCYKWGFTGSTRTILYGKKHSLQEVAVLV